MENMNVEKKTEVAEVSTFRKFLYYKAHYFAFMSAGSAIFPYLFVYAKQLGITADVVGYITATIWCITVLSRPLIGGLADHFKQKLKLMLFTFIMIGITSDLGLTFIPESPLLSSSNSTNNSSMICHNNNSYITEFKKVTCVNCCPLSCSLCKETISECENVSLGFLEQIESIPPECSEDLVIKCLDGALKKDCNTVAGRNATDSGGSVAQNGAIQVSLFGIFATLLITSVTSIEALTAAACTNSLGDQADDLGTQIAWGTIGFALVSLAAGGLNHAFSKSNGDTNYFPGFYIAILFYLLDIFVVSKLQLEVPKIAKSIFKNVAWLLLKPRIIIFLLEVIAAGMLRGLYSTYSLWYLETIGASSLLLGSVTCVQSFLGEIPFLFLSGWIIRKIGHLNVFTMSFIAQGLRLLAYSFLMNPWWALLIEVLQGPAFGSFYAGLTTYGKHVAPPGAEATVQGISLSAMDGIGTSMGNLIGGYCVHRIGGRETFYQGGLLSIGFAMMSCILNGFIMCKIFK